MQNDDKAAIIRRREHLVVKHNDLVQKSRFQLSLQEQKTVAYICSMIKPTTPTPTTYNVPFQLEYTFDIRQYCMDCGFDHDSGGNYENVKATLKKLRDRSMWLEIGDKSILVGWLAKATTNKKSGIATIRVDEDLVPFLYALGKNFTQYNLYNILAMRSAFSVRIYELMKSHAYKREPINYELDALKRLLMVDGVASYSRFPDFRRRVLEPAMKEINELTDIRVMYRTKKNRAQKVTDIEFVVMNKNDLVERWQAAYEVEKRLNAHERGYNTLDASTVKLAAVLEPPQPTQERTDGPFEGQLALEEA
jgi:plasmid replication initiation protein